MNQERNQEEDFYLSDIHIELENKLIDQAFKTKRSTKIEFQLPDCLLNENSTEIKFDPDDDPILKRRPFIFIEHEVKTTLNLVGLQLWRASFYLIDYLLNNLDTIRQKQVVDLGAGLGVTSLFGCIYAETVYCTDLEQVIKQAEHNWRLNKEAICGLTSNKKNLIFKTLDWSKDVDNEQKNELANASVFIASDVVYDDFITDCFLKTLYNLMTNGARMHKVCLVANEKRINFNLANKAVQDTAFNHFMKGLNELNEYQDNESKYLFKCRRIDKNIEILKFVDNYKRNEFLYIWRIECLPID